jgi:MFS family permease
MLIFSLLLMGVATYDHHLLVLLRDGGAGAAEHDVAVLHHDRGRHHGPLGIPLFAALSDRVGRRSLCLWAALAGLWAFPLFWLIDTGNPLLIALSFSAGMVIFAMLYGPMGAFLPELYGTRLRYSGAAASYNLGGVLGGAFAPLVAGWLLASTGGSWSISLYVLALAAASFACISLLSETYLTDLAEIRAEERELIAKP